MYSGTDGETHIDELSLDDDPELESLQTVVFCSRAASWTSTLRRTGGGWLSCLGGSRWTRRWNQAGRTTKSSL